MRSSNKKNIYKKNFVNTSSYKSKRISAFSLPKILLTTGPIWFFYTEDLFINPGKIYKYFGAGILNPHKINNP